MNNFLYKMQSLSESERIIEATKFRWIGYSQAEEILQKMEFLKLYPKRLRMPNVLLIGDSNNGKTHILDKFQKINQPFINENDGELTIPTLYVLAPHTPDEKTFYQFILDSLFAPSSSSEKLEVKYARVIHLLKKTNVKLIMIDEIQNILAGSLNKQRIFLNIIKNLSNVLQISFVLSGTKEAFNAINTDVQLRNRFEPYVLNLWQYNNEYARLLKSFEQILPLRKESNLTAPKLSKEILRMSEGLIGEISKIIESSSIAAIKSGNEKIDLDIVRNIKYTPASNRT